MIIKISKQNYLKVTLYLMILFLIRPGYILHTSLAIFFNIGAYITQIIVLFLFCIYFKKIIFDLLPFFFYYFFLFFSTFINDGNLIECFKQNSTLLTAIILFEIFLKIDKKILLGSRLIFEICTYINLISIILFPNGLYSTLNYSSNWFLGFNNIHIRTTLPGLLLSYMYTYTYNGKIDFRSILLNISIILSSVLVGSTTSILGIVLFNLFFILMKLDIFSINCYFVIIFIGIMNLLLFVQSKLNIISFFVVNILHKDITFTGRNVIWANAINSLNKHIIIGRGFLTDNDFVNLLFNKLATHPHNFLLYILMMGGLVLMFIFIWILYLSLYKLKENEKFDCSKVLLSGIYSFLIMGLTESLVGTKFLFPLFVLALNIKLFRSMEV